MAAFIILKAAILYVWDKERSHPRQNYLQQLLHIFYLVLHILFAQPDGATV